MDAQIIPFPEPEIVTTDDGRTLTAQQSAAVLIHVRDGLKGRDLAKAAGYASEQTVNGFLRSELGRAGVQAAARIVLAQAGAIGLQVVVELAQKSKSDKVRLDAAIQLMQGAGLVSVDPRQPGTRPPSQGQGISISINLSGSKQDAPALVDVTPDEQS